MAAHWLLYQHRWLDRASRVSGIHVGNIVEVDLGVNYRGEYSLRHPCIVLRKAGPLVTVVPMTSQQPGRGVAIVSGTVVFPKITRKADEVNLYRIEFNTPGKVGHISVALVEQIRTVAVERILSKRVDHTKSDVTVPQLVLFTIHRQLVDMASPSVASEMNRLRTTLTIVNRKKNKLLVRIKKAESKVAALEEDLERSDKEIETLLEAIATGQDIWALEFVRKRRSPSC